LKRKKRLRKPPKTAAKRPAGPAKRNRPGTRALAAKRARIRKPPGLRLGPFRSAGLVVLGLAALGFCYVLAVRFPSPFFARSVSRGNITLHSDRLIADNARALLAEVSRRLSRSTIDNPGLRHHIYICNSRARFLFFANRKFRMGGICYVGLGRNVFLRQSLISRNRLVGPTGRIVEGERTLVYYMAHELTHGLVASELGLAGYLRVPEWIREGYADYIGKGKIDMEKAASDLKAGAPAMDPDRSGLYLKYHLLVAYLLDVKGVTVLGLLRGKFDMKSIEKQVLELERFPKYPGPSQIR
jgi:hypothetical protein